MMIRDSLDKESRADQYALILQDCWRKEIERAISPTSAVGGEIRNFWRMVGASSTIFEPVAGEGAE